MRKGLLVGAALTVAGLGIPGAGAAAPAQVKIVEPSGDAMSWTYNPVDITVKAGSTVTWVNDGGQVHTVTAKDKSWTSPNLGQGATFARKFPAAGEFAYYCQPHPWMKAVIKVTG